MFYVWFCDFVDNDDFKFIFISFEVNFVSYYLVVDLKYYYKYGVNFFKMGIEKIVEYYFCLDDEVLNDVMFDGMWVVFI